MIRQVCELASKILPSVVIPNELNKYLTRHYLLLKDRDFGNAYLHHFHRSDLDRGETGSLLLHNHPWSGVSFILTGGYIEERLMPGGIIVKRLVEPLTFNFISHDTFHRVDLLMGEAWTLFFTGPRYDERDWCFWDRDTKEHIDWRTRPGAVA